MDHKLPYNFQGNYQTNTRQSNNLSKAIMDRTRFCNKFLKDRLEKNKKQKTAWDYLDTQNLNTSLIKIKILSII